MGGHSANQNCATGTGEPDLRDPKIGNENTVPVRFMRKIDHLLERHLPEQRLYLRNDTATRFLRIRPSAQAAVLLSGAVLVGWTAIATAILVIDGMGADGLRDQARRQQEHYRVRLNDMAGERDTRAVEAQRAQERFYVALDQISKMQSALLRSEDRRKELETGLEVVQRKLRAALKERDRAVEQSDNLLAELQASTGNTQTIVGHTRTVEETVDYLTLALARTASERDQREADYQQAERKIQDLKHRKRLATERNERIFSRLEEAVNVSVTPLQKMFEEAGVSTDKLLDDVRRGYNGQGGPLTPIAISTRNPEDNIDSLRANELLAKLDTLNTYRLAAFSLPFGMPVKSRYRMSSGFGMRTHPVTHQRRMHDGMDMAAPTGTPVYATADGVVTFAGWSNGYGRLVKIRHALGFETRYAHNSKLRVKVGQRVSRGDRIADMGSSGRSTGPHVHYEVRIGGRPVNPMKYIRAARNVF